MMMMIQMRKIILEVKAEEVNNNDEDFESVVNDSDDELKSIDDDDRK
jgi:hypothetical protein